LLINNIKDEQLKQELLDIHSHYKNAEILIDLEIDNEDKDFSFVTPEMSMEEIHEIMSNMPKIQSVMYPKGTIIKVSPSAYFSNMYYVVFPNSYCGSLRSDKFKLIDN